MPQAKIQQNSDNSEHLSLSLRISARVREIRKARGLTLRQLSDLTNGAIAYQNLSGLELGKQEWRVAHLELVACALGVDPRELLPPPDASDTPGTHDTHDTVRENPDEFTPAEREIVALVRKASPEAIALLGAIGAIAGGVAVLAANRDVEPGATRRKLERLLDPPRQGAPKGPADR